MTCCRGPTDHADEESTAGSERRMETMERLYDELDQANLDLQYHVKIGILAWGGDPGPPETPADIAWRERFEELRSRRDVAEGAILEAITRESAPEV